METTNYEDLQNKDGFYLSFPFLGNSLNSSNTDFGNLFNVTNPIEIISISISYDVKDNNSGTVNLVKVLPGSDSTSGDLICPFFDLGLTTGEKKVWTKINGDFTQTPGTNGQLPYQLFSGQRIGFLSANTPINLRSLSITIYAKHLGKGHYMH